MLEKVDLKKTISKENYKKQIKPLQESLASLDGPMKVSGLPVIILFEGWGGAGKGSVISRLILNFDPRWFTVVNTQPPTDLERREPTMWRHWLTLPEAGQMSIMDRSWYQEVSILRLEDEIDDLTNLRRMNEINSFERGLTDNGYLIIKFFLHITQKEQKARLEKLDSDKNTEWRVTANDWRRCRQYDKYCDVFDQMLEYTNTPYAPWHVISGMNDEVRTLEVFRTVNDAVHTALKLREEKAAAPQLASSIIQPGQYHFVQMPQLSEIDLSKSLEKEKYKKQLKKEQACLSELHNKIYRKKMPVIIVYEGWDAAGKGGNIKRVSEALDPRGYEVVPIAAPSREEKNRHYLWRFWRKLPRDGHIAIFDRSWYGRVMVERIEGFCSAEDWQRAYREINEFERQLYDWGAVVIKFWLQIDADEQLRRFEERKNTPSKQWKITDEDWRNREKWPQYETAVNEMMQYTSTDFAPWHIVESNDKKYARIKALKIINQSIEDRLNGNKKRQH
ncbi:MAG: polyphosphate:AMP phosphotransferase [Oscillospiraceae bacterium]|nr:polyphosphate:AMP phosphotransferase [Oscillospiraceae bacterium]MDD3260739.1 polyphosphate:AMP phosphotransferase [Oscillospiraceae bacterium]